MYYSCMIYSFATHLRTSSETLDLDFASQNVQKGKGSMNQSIIDASDPKQGQRAVKGC